jgi:hypothetical protein
MPPSFVLNELRHFLFVRQFRLEIVRTAEMCQKRRVGDGQLWPRVEIRRPFVLWKLRRFLHFAQNRVEMRLSETIP